MGERQEGGHLLPDLGDLARDAVAVDLEVVRAWRGHSESPDVLAELRGETHEGGPVLHDGLDLGAIGLILHDDVALEIGLGGVEVHRLAEPSYGRVQEPLGVEGARETLHGRVIEGGEVVVECHGMGDVGRLGTDALGTQI